MTKPNDVLEHNVSSLLESGGEPPRIADAARARIRDELIARHTAPPQRRLARRLAFAGLGLAAAAAVLALVFVRGGKPAPIAAPGALADGTTFVAEPGARVTVLGPRHVRVEGEALLDVVPGKGPFVVETARGRIEVLGTRFVVDGELDRTLAAVVRGEVKLATDLGDVVLHAGEQGVAEPGRAPTRGPAPRLSHLVSWAREARQPDQPVHHGTLFARDPGVRSHPPWGHEYPLPIKQLTLDVQIEDQVARVAIDQTFHNDRNEELEGVYRFAIPPDAALQRLAMYVDGKLEESAVVERMKARRIYENLVYRRIDPALLEWAGTGRLSLRVYPIHAGQDKRLMLAYTQSLPRLYDDWTLTVPLPEVDRAVGDLEIALRVKGCAGCELTSPSYPIKVTRDGDDAIVHAHEIATKLGDSFVLHVRDPRAAVTLATQTDAGDRYVMVRAPAGAIALERKAAAYRPRTWVILDDTSASREPLELRAQQDLIDSFLKELDENDRVAVIAFDVTARQKLAPTRVLDVDRAAVRKALADEGGVGATDFEVALDAATQALAGVAPDDARIVYLGDGVITAGPRELDKLRAKIVGRARFIGVGVGDGPDTQTLDALAAATGGYATTIDLADDLGWRAFDLVAALHTARVTDVSAHLVDAAGQLVPATAYLASPQLADGEELELVAKLAGDGTPAALVVDGTLDGAPWHRRIALDTPPHADAGYLPRMWAQRHIAARLLAKHEPPPPCTGARCPSEADAREARDEAIRQEVVALGKRYFLLSRHTSLLVLENDAMYAQYGVTKGSGDTWAPYALPATIPVE
ncbi:MAG TPA: VIT domain-containing protein, partial [Kofleriaceae bacterium]|nr:VIT domain-containing protein [Kofleriaceae bacterium]